MRFFKPSIPHSLKYNPNLDGLRGIAILLVIFFHFFPNFVPFGFVGVDIFFLLSGFLITTIILKKLGENKFSLKEFYRNRVRRLFPALIFALLLTLFVGCLFLFPEELADLGKHIKSTAFYYENFQLIGEIGYWDIEALEKPLLHMWSLSVEEQFYIFWPFIVLVIFKIVKSSNQRFFIFSLIFLFFYLISLYFSISNPDKAFYHTLSRAWELSLGGVLAVIISYKGDIIKIFIEKFHNFLIFLIPTLILYAYFFLNIQQFAPLKLFPFLIITSLVIMKVTFIKDFILSNKLLMFTGLISYSLYIWHYIILSFLHIFGYDTNLFIKLCALLFTIIISIFSFYVVEIPIRKSNSYLLAVFITSTLFLIGLLGQYIYLKKGLPERLIVKQNKNIDFSREKPVDKNCLFIVKEVLDKKPLFDYCRSTTKDRREIKVVILGDSHGFILFEGLSKILKKNGIESIVLSNSGCPPYIDSFMGRNLKEVKSCRNKVQEIYKVLNRLKNIKLVIFTSRLSIYTTEKGFGEIEKHYNKRPHKFSEYYKNKETYNPYNVFLSKVNKTFEYFSQKKIPLLFVLDNPELGFSPKKCLKRLFLPIPYSCKLSYKTYWNRQGKIKKDIKYLSLKYKNVILFDLADILCDKEFCYVFKNGQTLYSDDDHLSKYGSYLVGKKLFKIINKILKEGK